MPLAVHLDAFGWHTCGPGLMFGRVKMFGRVVISHCYDAWLRFAFTAKMFGAVLMFRSLRCLGEL